MNFSSINIQGNIVSSEILDKIRSEEKFKHQQPEAFGLARTASLRDEIGMAWAIMRTHWQAYKKRLETLPKGDTGTTLTRERLIIPLLSELGYETIRSKAQVINAKSYAISHVTTNKDQFPIHIMGYNDHLDKRRESGGPRLSPHALVQEYLNNTEHLYALATNGKQLRLLRDATRLVRMSYLEFDLEGMFEEELYADFSILFRVLHATRMPEQIDCGSDSIIEYYHQESMASGTRIREKLSEAVEDSIKTLANGFLEHQKNEDLIQLFEDNKLNSDEYYTHQLRLIYRILFLIVLEERKLIYPEGLSEDQQRFRAIYYRYYSIERLRKLTENRVYVDADKHDLWESLKTTFLLFEYGEYGAKLGIKPLGSGLFAPNAIGTLKAQFLSNGNLIEVLKRLTTFISDQKTLVRVNYSDLDVEEFGSVYEGLLEYDPKVQKIGAKWQFSFEKGDGRSSSGSHYTPEELVKPLIKHSLDYIIADKLKVPDNVIESEAKQSLQEKQLLSITVCDVACGSGHILLSAARKIATELASIREGAEQPSPTYYRAAIKDVIRNCIYGVDLNPLAVELCKVALWLEAHNPNEPLNFLDHHIKCGNAIVGLAHFEELQNGIATEAFKTLSGDKKEFAATLRKKNTAERKSKQISTFDTEKEDLNLQGIQKEFADFTRLPETTPEEIRTKTLSYKKLTEGKKWYRLKNLANLQVAQFFISKTKENKEKLTTNAKYSTYLNTGAQIQDRGAAMTIAQDKRFFHWFLEFPEVFSNEGFDCILGNPPYLGGGKISSNYGHEFLNSITTYYPNSGGQADLVIYFLRRYYQLLKPSGFLGVITTNSVCEAETRLAGIQFLLGKGGQINFAVKSIRWPGEAKLNVSLFSYSKAIVPILKYLDTTIVKDINSFFQEGIEEPEPMILSKNSNKLFMGIKFLGEGFLLNKEDAKKMISSDFKNKEVIFDLINGRDINDNPNQTPTRKIINFYDWDIETSKKYKLPFHQVMNEVKPIRDEDKRESRRNKWWIYAERSPSLFEKLKGRQFCIATAVTSKYLNFTVCDANFIFTEALFVIPNFNDKMYAILQSSFHTEWARKYSSSLSTTLRYGSKSCFNNFPFSIGEIDTSIIEEYIDTRTKYMKEMKISLTDFYNNFHNKKTIGNKFFDDFRILHQRLDQNINSSYNWNNVSEVYGQKIQLRHDFYEVDYLPENDRVRYTIHPDARKEVLKRLLLLNHERFEKEVKQGLHKKKDVVAFYKQKNQELPEGTIFSDVKTKAKKVSAKKIITIAGQEDLFAANTPNIMKEFSLHDGIYTIRDAAAIINKSTDRVRRWFIKLSEINYEGLDNSEQQDIDQKRISFHGLIELVVIGELIEEGFRIQKIFKSRMDLANKTGKVYPFATNDVNQRLRVSGSDITWEFKDGNVTLNGKGQFNIELVREFFRDIEFDTSGIAQRIVPTKGFGKIEITPKRAGGKPSIISQQGVRVETILRFYDGPESIDDIISDYGISKEDINAAVAFQS